MKHEKISIKWKIFIYMLSFNAILLLLLWLFQTVYLDNFYKSIKKKQIANALDNLVSVIDEEELEAAVNTIANRYDICVLITDKQGETICSAETNMGCSLHKFMPDELKELYTRAGGKGGELQISIKKGERSDNGKMPQPDGGMKENEDKPSKKETSEDNALEDTSSFEESSEEESSKEKSSKKESSEKESSEEASEEETSEEETSKEKAKEKPEDSKSSTSDKNKEKETERFEKLPNMPNSDNMESIIRVRLVTTSEGEKYAIMVDSVITPVDATVHTLRIQLIYISVIMVLLSMIIAFIISKRVSKSIIGINSTAKELAKGNFDVEFTGKDYREVAELSQTLNHTAKELSKSDVLQKELLANVSHDLRTPLTMITAYSEVMRDLPGENTPENVQVIIDEANRLTCLVNDLLDISKIQAGVTGIQTKEYDLTESIKAIIERHSKLLEPYGYKIVFQYSENVLVNADEFKIYQVIYNLIANAVNYAGEDRVVTVTQITDSDKVRIEVKDNGQGIPKDKLDSVWERYYKVDKEHKRAIMGSGLGLSIVKNILVMHHAKYGVISEEGKGSTFWFELSTVE